MGGLMARTFRIDVNTKYSGKLQRGSPHWFDFNNSFTTTDLTTAGLADHINHGHAYTAPHHKTRQPKYDTYRNQLNVISHPIIALDAETLDERSTLDWWLADAVGL